MRMKLFLDMQVRSMIRQVRRRRAAEVERKQMLGREGPIEIRNTKAPTGCGLELYLSLRCVWCLMDAGDS